MDFSNANAIFAALRQLGVDPAMAQGLFNQPAPAAMDPATTGAVTPAPASTELPTRPAGATPFVPGGALRGPDVPGAPVQGPELPAFNPAVAPAPAQVAQVAPAKEEGFFGGDFVKNLSSRGERAAAWIAPPGNASAALGFRNAEESERNNLSQNNRQDQQLALNREAQAINAQLKIAPTVSPRDSENGAFRIFEKTNPLTGEVTLERKEIPLDERKVAEKKYIKPSAYGERELNEDEGNLVKNSDLATEGAELRAKFRDGKVSMSLIGKTEAELQTLANSGSEEAANAMRVRTYIQAAANAQLRNEKGVQTDSDAKRIQSEILSGSSQLNDKQVYEWMGKYLGKVNTDAQVRSNRATSRLKAYGPDYDPDGGRASSYSTYQGKVRSAYDTDSEGEKTTPFASRAAAASGGGVPAPRVTSPIEEDLRRRGVIR